MLQTLYAFRIWGICFAHFFTGKYLARTKGSMPHSRMSFTTFDRAIKSGKGKKNTLTFN